jgi:hypothetical protein
MVRTTMPHLRYSNIWEPAPESEIDRLEKKLYTYLKKLKISQKMNKEEREQFVFDLLNKQKYTCAFGKNIGGKYCWNKPKYSNIKYLHLEFSHIFSSALPSLSSTLPSILSSTLPSSSTEEPIRIKYFYLLCTRCNKQIQSSRNLFQLQIELENKLKHIDELLKKL